MVNKVTVTVTQEDIDAGQTDRSRMRARVCPIARAISRVVEDFDAVGHGGKVYLDSSSIPIAILPDDIKEWMRKADKQADHKENTAGLLPITFEFERKLQ